MSTASSADPYLRDIVRLVEERERKRWEAMAAEAGAPRFRVIGVRTRNGESQGRTLESESRVYRIEHARCALEARDVLCSAEQDGANVILTTALTERELGLDVVARLARAKLYPRDEVGTLLRMFRASSLDPALARSRIARILVEHQPREGYPPVPAGLLSASALWEAFFLHVLELPGAALDLTSLLEWTLDDARRGRFEAMDAELRAEVRDQVEATLGPAGSSVMAFVASGHGRDAFALAVVCDVLFAAGAEDESGDAPDRDDAAAVAEARVRLERYHGDRPLDAGGARKLAAVARDLAGELAPPEGEALTVPGSEERQAVEAALVRADEILDAIQTGHLAHRGALTPAGFDQRLARLGEEILRASKSEAELARRRCGQRLEAIEKHRMARRRGAQVERARMALRLLRWLRTEPAQATSFEEHALRYLRDSSHADRAREWLVGGEEESALSRAYVELGRRAFERRRSENHAFARSLATWLESPTSTGSLIGVEEVIPRVAARLLETGKSSLLLIVLDGMSWSVALELLDDLRRSRRAEPAWLSGDEPAPPAVVATVPGVTSLSRASLLAGELVEGSAPDETKRFAAAPALLAASRKRKSHPPLLFHKAELTEGGRGPLSREVAEAIAASERRVVGVVVNAIDDHLGGAQQVRQIWGIDWLPVLGTLISSAFEAGRVVMLASDHGHTYHREGERRKGDSADRWRPAGSGDVDDGEILLRGPRVHAPDGEREVVALWDEALRYSTPRNGYHGGATPQEMLAPLAIVTPPGRDLEEQGLVAIEVPSPDWWAPEREAERPREEPRPEERRKEKKAPARPELAAAEATGEAEAAAPAADWIDRLLASPVYEAQRALASKHAPDPERIRRVLALLDDERGSMTPIAFAQRADVLPSRLAGFLSQLQRVLNVDGYEVIVHDRERSLIKLDRPLLEKQFEI